MSVKYEVTEKCMQPIWNKIRYVGCGKKNATVEAQFADESTAKELLTLTLGNDEMILLPTYLGRRTAKIKVEEIPADLDVLSIAAAVTYDMEEKMSILQIQKKEAEYWKGQLLEMVVQASPQILEGLSDRVFIGEELSVKGT